MWQFCGAFSEQNCNVFGLNLFEYSQEWKDCHERVEITEPRYGEKPLLNKYSICFDNEEHYFLCGEFSNSVYGFYVEQ